MFSDGTLTVGYDVDAAGVRDGVLGVCSGFLDNASELADELGLPPSVPAHALIAAGYRRWGPGMPARLRGSFALLVWDSSRREGFLAVDHLGAGSVVYRRSPRALDFATEARELLPLLGDTPGPDERVLVRWLVDGDIEPHETLVAGVERLPGGHRLSLGSGTCNLERYWAPRYRTPAPIARTDAACELRAGIAQATGRGCRRAAPNGILLSGGLDSGAVAAVARSSGEQLVAYSVVFPGHPGADESALVAESARALGVPAGFVSFRRGGSLAASLRYLDSWRLPPASPNLFFHEPLLELARSEGMAAVLDGQGGDELFGRSPYLAADRLRAGRLVATRRLLALLVAPDTEAVKAARRHVLREVALKGVLPASLHRLARRRDPTRYAPGWLTTTGVELYAGGRSPWSWKEAAAPRWWAFLADALTRGRERAGVHDFFRHAFADAGLVGSHPLLEDVDLVETVLALPPEHAWDRRYDRPLLREALAGVLPDSVRLRHDKSFFNDVLADAVHVEDDAVIGRLLEGDAAIRRYVDGDLVVHLRALPPARRGRRETWLLWRLAVAECWLQMQEAPDFARTALASWNLTEPDVELLPSRAL